MSHRLPTCHLASFLLINLLALTGVVAQASATCSFLCEGNLMQRDCTELVSLDPQNAPVWESDAPPLIGVSCQVQCCAPGMCSDPQIELLSAGELTLLDPASGMALPSTFEEHQLIASGCVDHTQAFSIRSGLAQGNTYDVAHHGQVLARLTYDPPVTHVLEDMGGDADSADVDFFDADAGAPASEDMGTTSQPSDMDANPSGKDMSASSEQGGFADAEESIGSCDASECEGSNEWASHKEEPYDDTQGDASFGDVQGDDGDPGCHTSHGGHEVPLGSPLSLFATLAGLFAFTRRRKET